MSDAGLRNRWVLGARPRTLPAAVVPVVVGTAAAVGVPGTDVVPWRAVAALVVALAIQVGTNYVNDFADGERGTDDHRVGPVRLVSSGLATAKEVKLAALLSGAVAAVAGLALAAVVGPELLVVGAASFAAGYLYTGGPRPYGYLGLGELFVFVFFGLVATVGSTYVQLERVSGLSVAAAIPVGLLATALLVVNNLRDIPTDVVAGKVTLAVRLGDRDTRSLYATLLIGAFVTAAAVGLVRPGALAVLLAIPLAVPPVRTVLGGATGPRLIPVLGATGRVQLAAGGLLALGLALTA
ncbi:MAG: 1,4-dihydroxy-2-naphthoate polyprenyltransferase [uncultured Acidimicrobiales bacterium]|uniref:1,4-dihydroxy-2-naphthoate octaprenyltransferase n=1 Tax=uncultured Acidimicrobiales bacterium TaxID=310071 RepID=A0A6J4H203_9ACTN|nr:MAG: 1,4-dihydroxy-2-naphthoate polyprenyltransferase [uncultured Acidimicrobiales bacterium]